MPTAFDVPASPTYGTPQEPRKAQGQQDYSDRYESVPGADNLVYMPSPADQQVIALVMNRFQQASDKRRPHEIRWVNSYLMWRASSGDAWKYWNGTAIVSMQDASQSYSAWAAHNVLRSPGKKQIARIKQAKVDVSVSPQTSRTSDVMAAREARSVLAHCDAVTDTERQDQEVYERAVGVCPMYKKQYFDPSAMVPIPILEDPEDPESEIVNVVDKPDGEICQKVVSSFELYFDPRAQKMEESGWVLHVIRQPLEWLRANFGYGKYVKGDGGQGSPNAYLRDILDIVKLDFQKVPVEIESANLIEMWEKPSPAYPKGRYIFVSNGVLLYTGDWPYTFMKEYPFSQFVCEPGLETIYGDSGIYYAIDPQMNRNRALNKVVNHERNGDGKLILDERTELRSNAFQSGQMNEAVYYMPPMESTNWSKPEWIQSPPLDPNSYELMRICDSDIATIMDVNAASAGQVPNGVTAARAIEALQASDLTGTALLVGQAQAYKHREAENLLALARQFYSGPRLLSIRDTSPKDTKKANEVAANGGFPLLPPEVQMMMHQAKMQALQGTGATPEALQQMMQAGQGQPSMQGGMPLQAPQMPAQGPQYGNGTESPGSDPEGLGQGDDVQSEGGNLFDSSTKSERDKLDAPGAQAMAFKHLSEGRIEISSSTSAVKTPQERIRLITEMNAAGMFKPEQIPFTIAFLSQLDFQEVDKLRTDLIAALQKWLEIQQQIEQAKKATQPEQAPPDPIAIAQAEQQIKTQGEIAKVQATSQADIQKSRIESQARAQGDAAKYQVEAQAKIAQIQAETQQKMILAEQAHKYKLEEIALTAELAMKSALTTQAQGALVQEHVAENAHERERAATGEDAAREDERTAEERQHTEQQTEAERAHADEQAEIQRQHEQEQSEAERTQAETDSETAAFDAQNVERVKQGKAPLKTRPSRKKQSEAKEKDSGESGKGDTPPVVVVTPPTPDVQVVPPSASVDSEPDLYDNFERDESAEPAPPLS